jgi:isopentenyldiphosphate isomerase
MTSESEIYKEKIQVFTLAGEFSGMQDKTEFYNQIRHEYAHSGKVTRQVHTVRIFLMNASGGIYLTKRSKLKKENSLLYDKTIGAHIRGIESAEYTVLRESAEELGFPAAVLNDTEFTTSLFEADLRIVGVFKKVETINNFIAKYRYLDGTFSEFPQITTIFIGVFDGPVKFRDGETSGIEIYQPDELIEEFKKYPERYTHDLKTLIPRYLHEFKQIAQANKK